MSQYDILLSSNESTVVNRYESKQKRSGDYQTEADLEKEFIKILSSQGYEYAPHITSSEKMISNLREQLEKLNKFQFTDNEWKRFYENCIVKSSEGIKEKSKKIQTDHIQILNRDDGSTKNISLIDKNNIHNNFLQVINQYKEDNGIHKNRYDVTILINGIPIVHIELKRRGVKLREAFNQINRYQRESFWVGGLYEYIQIFVISNGTSTKYYSNTTRSNSISERENSKKNKNKTSNSFEFTSYWADANNERISDLVDFAKTFFARHSLLNVLTKYCIFTTQNKLVVMRPYQIIATERIINKIQIANNYKKMGTIDGGGYVWHTTGSGKTLTSFKTTQLASKLDYIDKVLFVVDRKDLDHQTLAEYQKFEEGSADGSKDTKTLKRQLEDKDRNSGYKKCKVIITTIQKLSRFIKSNPNHPVFNKNVVMIFDECHRTQFGEMHKSIIKNFKKYYIFGFTGTPIFSENSASSKNEITTTAGIFGERLHTYTIKDAIRDENVLPFKVDYVKTMVVKKEIDGEEVGGRIPEKFYLFPERISGVTKYILEHFNQKTKRASADLDKSINNLKNPSINNGIEKNRKNGFNSIFAVSSIEAAKLYYTEFKKQMSEDFSKKIKIATIYSFGVNDDSNSPEDYGSIDYENSDTVNGLTMASRDFLDMAIKDYNEEFGTSFDTSDEKFPNYYKDLCSKIKSGDIDLVIVVNMFLTGFDSPILNTLWVDKNLKMHGLIQAFSRTNRILNSVKTFGNIVCFRDLQEETDEAITLFADKNNKDIVFLKTYEEYFNGFFDENGKYHKGYQELIEELQENFKLGEVISSENDQREFISLFGEILKVKNILSSFDEFEEEKLIKQIDFQDYTGMYNDLHEKFRGPKDDDKNDKDVYDDIVFEMELVKQIEVNFDYILYLLEEFKNYNYDLDNDKNLVINKIVKSSPELRNKKELIFGFMEVFMNNRNKDFDILDEWKKFVFEKLQEDVQEIVNRENLNEPKFRKYIKDMFTHEEIKTTGTIIGEIIPTTSRFRVDGLREKRIKNTISIIKDLFKKYSGVIDKDNIEKIEKITILK